jgi:hypothetical protein
MFGLLPAGAALYFKRENVAYGGGGTDASHVNAIFFTLFGKMQLKRYTYG